MNNFFSIISSQLLKKPLSDKIGLFIVFIIIFIIFGYVYIRIIQFIDKKIQNYKFKFLICAILLPLSYGTFSNLISLWVLTQYFAWEIYLIILIISIIPSLLLFFYLCVIGDASRKEIALQEGIYSLELVEKINWINKIPYIFSILLYIAIGVIYFAFDVSYIKQTEYIIATFFIFGSIFPIINFYYVMKGALSPKIENKVRKDYIITSSAHIFNLSLISYFLLWIFDIDLFYPLFYIGQIKFCWFYLVIISTMFLFFFITILYSIGEWRRKKEEQNYLLRRKELIERIREKIDPNNVQETINCINSEIKSLNDEIASIQESIKEKRSFFSDLFIQEILTIFFELFLNKKPTDVVAETLSIMEKFTLEQINYINDIITELQFIVNNINSISLYQFKTVNCHNWLDSNNRNLDHCKSRPIYPKKLGSVINLLWTVINSVLGLPLLVILNYFSNFLI